MTKWKVPHPLHVVQAIIFDDNGQVFLMHRSDKVRSAKNVWSLPSGMHDIGESVHDCIARELQEEFDLFAKTVEYIGVYDNIAGDKEAEEQYHWVMSVCLVRVRDVNAATNKEPDKHDQMIAVPHEDLDNITQAYNFHPSLSEFLFRFGGGIKQRIAEILSS